MKNPTKENLEIWDMVHNWCEGLQERAYISDMDRRYLMDLIESYAKKYKK